MNFAKQAQTRKVLASRPYPLRFATHVKDASSHSPGATKRIYQKDCDESEIADVRNVYFEILSAMKMLNATTEELEEVVAEARLLDGGVAN
ncbi:MAG: hypothetical protein VXV91_08510, partial [Verrucomicrobiota bacterium]|nr:hypothetical protein [Verrucomicrobiota bacterium]